MMPNAELYVLHDFALGGGTHLRVDLSVFNVFNLKTVLDRGRNVNQLGSGLVVDQATFFNGYDTYIQDAKGAIYKLSPFALASAGVQSAEVFQHIAAHSTTTITLDYEVPLDASGLYWVTQTQSATPAVVELP